MVRRVDVWHITRSGEAPVSAILYNPEFGGEGGEMNCIGEPRLANAPGTVLHWYDFTCPFCYVGQQRNAILVRRGFDVVERAFQAHPDIPTGGIAARLRSGLMYAMLEREASDAGLPLHWPQRLPNTRRALAAAEWVRRHQPSAFSRLREELFNAHFVLGEDLEDPAVIDRHAIVSGVDFAALHAAFATGVVVEGLTEAETSGRRHGVDGTPAWLVDGRLIVGLRPAAAFERLTRGLQEAPEGRIPGDLHPRCLSV